MEKKEFNGKKKKNLMKKKEFVSPPCRAVIYNKGLVINYGEEGGLQNGSIAVRNFLRPTSLKTG